ncbi:uncharacterized protein LOC132057907 [Lycium ferocissimum]|uniref:uncharacterized protein LOC132057907 n=1 Tax=Lycium ferocissimum TaxID=112874 RepID=UPI0028168F78|nr:uncharacterized protein LOC132057907 [Lycium ferocissimum]
MAHSTIIAIASMQEQAIVNVGHAQTQYDENPTDDNLKRLNDAMIAQISSDAEDENGEEAEGGQANTESGDETGAGAEKKDEHDDSEGADAEKKDEDDDSEGADAEDSEDKDD